MSDSLPSDAPRPRLCHLRKWPDFNGYGFNLHAERGKAGQFIGTVDADSPAVAADLRPGDRIIEVNGTNIGSENHQQVVQRIKAVPDETRLLVLDQEADNYYKEHKIVVRGDLENVNVCESPMINPYTNPTTEPSTLMDAVKMSDSDECVSGADVEDSSAQTLQMTSDDTAAAAAPVADIDYMMRLCHLKTWPDFAGYGFNLHADRATPGQYVGKVDDGSPAEAAGLRLHDRIVEVNGVVVDGKSHAEVVANIKSVPGEVRLLVVDAETDELCRNNGVEISSSSQRNIHTIVCPDYNPHSTTVNGEQEAAVSLPQEEREDKSEAAHDKMVIDSSADIDSMQYEQHVHIHDDDLPQQHSAVVENVSASSTERVSTTSQSVNTAGATVNVGGPADNVRAQPVVVGGIEFAASAKEARERMKRKSDVKQSTNLSLRDKYELLQKL